MPAYVVAYVGMRDPEPLQRYAAAVTATVERYGGRFLFAGPRFELLDGDWPGDVIAIIEFPSQADARRWHASAEYADVLPLRQAAGPTGLVVTQDVGVTA